MVLLGVAAVARPPAGEPILLWPDSAPGALGADAADCPTLTPFLPEPGRATGAALVICPGGGYARLAQHEGGGYAELFTGHGATTFVLRYRLGSDGYRHPAMLQDAARAVRLVRSRAADWNIDPARIGIVGSSAGGHLASTLLTHFDGGDPEAGDPVDRVSSRPDLGILCYPVITMGEDSHAGSRSNLLGSDPTPGLVRLLSNELQVRSNTPPCFVWHTVADPTVRVENSLRFADALNRAGISFELHLYEVGGHGMGLGRDGGTASGLHPWTEDCLRWLRRRDYVH